MRSLRTVFLVALVLWLLFAGWSFRSGNAGRIDLDLVWIRLPNVEVWWALSAAVAAGSLLTGTVIGLAWLRQRILNRRQRKVIERLESEVQRLKSLPVAVRPTGPHDAPVEGPSVFTRFFARRREGRS